MQYHYFLNGQESYPIEIDTIREMIKEGKLPAETMVRPENETEYITMPSGTPKVAKPRLTQQIPMIVLIASLIILFFCIFTLRESELAVVTFYFITSLICYHICGYIARYKGLKPPPYKWLGALTGLLGVIIVLSIPDR